MEEKNFDEIFEGDLDLQQSNQWSNWAVTVGQ